MTIVFKMTKVHINLIKSRIFLNLFYILMQPHHLVMHILDPNFLIKIHNCCKTNTILLLCRDFPLSWLLIVIINITVLDEFLPKLPHTLSIFRCWTIPQYTCSFSWSNDLSLWKTISIRMIRWFVTWKIPTLNRKNSTLLFLEFLLLISFEM